MANISGNYGSQQTKNGVVELLTPLHLIWRRAIEWGGTAALGSDGISVTITTTNLPKEGEVVKINSSGKAVAVGGNLAATDSGTTSLALVWTGYEVADSAAVDVLTVIDAPRFLYEVSADRVNTTAGLSSGHLVFWDSSISKYWGHASSGLTNTTEHSYLVGICEGSVTRNSATYYRIMWNRGPQIKL